MWEGLRLGAHVGGGLKYVGTTGPETAMLVKTSNSFEFFQDFEAISDDKKLILVKKSATKFVSPNVSF